MADTEAPPRITHPFETIGGDVVYHQTEEFSLENLPLGSEIEFYVGGEWLHCKTISVGDEQVIELYSGRLESYVVQEEEQALGQTALRSLAEGRAPFTRKEAKRIYDDNVVEGLYGDFSRGYINKRTLTVKIPGN